MPRGKKKTFEEQLDRIENEMKACERKLEKLKGERNGILQAKREAEISALYNAIQSSGISVDEVVDILTERQQVEREIA